MDINVSKWTVIYPSYLNSRVSCTKGRRVAKDIAVDSPNLHEISECLQFLKIRHTIEQNKTYSRDILARGRCRCELKNEDGIYMNSEIKSKKQVLLKLCDLIPRLKSRGEEAKDAANAGKGGKNKKNRNKKRR